MVPRRRASAVPPLLLLALYAVSQQTVRAEQSSPFGFTPFLNGERLSVCVLVVPTRKIKGPLSASPSLTPVISRVEFDGSFTWTAPAGTFVIGAFAASSPSFGQLLKGKLMD